MKFNKNYKLIWTKQIGLSSTDRISSVIEMDTANYMIAAKYFNLNNLKNNIWLLKIDPDGEKIWSNEDGQQHDLDVNDMSSDNSGNLYLSGSVKKQTEVNRDFYFAKYDNNGVLVWDKNFGSDANDEMTAIDFDGISSFYLTGFTEGNYKKFVNKGKKDFVYMKYTDDGTEESNYQFGTEEEDVLNSVQKIARELRALNFMVLTETLRRSMKAQMREANKCNADLAIIIGEQEKNDKTVQVKNLNDGSQQTIEQKNIFEHFKSLTL